MYKLICTHQHRIGKITYQQIILGRVNGGKSLPWLRDCQLVKPLVAACRLVLKENSIGRDILDESYCVTPMVTQISVDQIAPGAGAALEEDRSSTRYYPIAQRFVSFLFVFVFSKVE